VLIRAFLLLALTASPALAWEVDGFRSGMPEAEAVAKLEQRGSVHGYDFGVQSRGYFIVKEPGPSLTLCAGRLVSIKTEVAGGWHTFIRLVDREERTRGQGGHAIRSEETSVGPVSRSMFFWWKGQEKITVEYQLINTQTPRVYRHFTVANLCNIEGG
jgi:hypothetical protein